MNEGFNIENGVLISYSGDDHSIVIPRGVKTIGKEVFKGMAWITDVTLPQGLTEIGESAFKGCRKLEKMIIPEGLNKIGDFAFHRCHSLTEVSLPDSVTRLGRGTFLYCDSLRKLQAFGVKQLDIQTFANNTQLTDIAFSCEIDCSNFKNDIFTGCIGIKDIRLSGGYHFHTDDLFSVLINGSKVQPVVRAVAESLYQSMEIENGVLYKLHVNLKSFELPEGIRCVEKNCFCDKKGIVSISFPASIERIGANAFGNCINLEQIIFKNENISIDNMAFKGCSNLKAVNIGSKNYKLGGINYDESVPYIIRQINDQVMSEFYISGKTLMSYSGNEERVTVPEGVEVIGESCFEGNEKLGRILIPDTVREIQENAFRNCICMQSAVMSENLCSIGAGAFENCRRLIRFNTPKSLAEVGFAAFRGCVSLENEGFEKATPAAVRTQVRIYSSDDIAPYSFCDNAAVTELTVDKPIIIGKYAFSACLNLTKVVIRNKDCIIEKNAFEKCLSLREVSVTAGKIEKGAFSYCRGLEKAEISGITVLEDEVFAGCYSLKEIRLSDSVKEIGKRCFDECVSLGSFDLTNIRKIGGRAFERCDSLKEIIMTKCDVGYHAFADCRRLKNIVLDSDTVLHSGAFFGCTFTDTVVLDGRSYPFGRFSESKNTADNSLPIRVQEVIGSVYSCFEVNKSLGIVKYRGDAKSVRIPHDIVSIEDEAFRDRLRVEDIVFPEGVKYCGKMAFSGTWWLEKRRKEVRYNIINGLLIDGASCGEAAEIPKNVQRICSWAFAGNTGLKKLILNNGRITVDVFAFRNCINLKTVRFADGCTYTLESIRDIEKKEYPPLVRRIFSECINCFKLNDEGVLTESTGNIKDLVFPDGIRTIGEGVYMDCNLLESIRLSKETEYIGKFAFKNSKWLKSVQNAAHTIRLEAQAFSGCKSLEDIDLSDNVEFMGSRVFEHCCKLRDIHISSKLTAIPERAFFRCKSLKKVVIPSSVKLIGPQAFAFCSELEEVIFCNREGIEIADDAFAWCEKL